MLLCVFSLVNGHLAHARKYASLLLGYMYIHVGITCDMYMYMYMYSNICVYIAAMAVFHGL